jgi:ADP-ribose pyrophosphatase
MSNHEQYLAFAKAHPKLFENVPGATIIILLDEDEINEVERKAAGELSANGLPTDWARVGIVYQDQYVFLLRDAVRFPDGSTGTYIRFVDPDESAPGVVMLPVYRGHVLLEHHFRHAARNWFLELPRGFGIPGLSTEETVKRELEQEIGAVVSNIIPLGQTRPDTGMVSDCVELFYIDVESYGRPDLHEGIDAVREVTLAEFERLIGEGEITCGFTLAAYAQAKIRGLL